MIQTTVTLVCTQCGSAHIIKNGFNRYGKQQFRCKACGKSGVLNPTIRYTPAQRAQILASYRERPSMWGVQRLYGVSRPTLASWLKKKAQSVQLVETLVAAQPDDVLELDEVWSFVYCLQNKQWLWTALCRRTRQIVAFVIGDHSARTCAKLWRKIPEGYKQCHTFSDFWKAYAQVFPQETHRSVGKDSGETNHMERWNNTLRQRQARYVRKTLSFSKSECFHHLVTKWFIAEYNLERII